MIQAVWFQPHNSMYKHNPEGSSRSFYIFIKIVMFRLLLVACGCLILFSHFSEYLKSFTTTILIMKITYSSLCKIWMQIMWHEQAEGRKVRKNQILIIKTKAKVVFKADRKNMKVLIN